jgi:hypothetical protein
MYCNIINIYILPDTSPEIPAHYVPQITQLAYLPNIIVAGDFNAKHTGWYTLNSHNARGVSLATQFDNMFILNNTDEHTHVPQ